MSNVLGRSGRSLQNHLGGDGEQVRWNTRASYRHGASPLKAGG
jgi:hypothetical protein